jgi:hypothetical protein
MDFDHREPEEKVFNIGMNKSRFTLKRLLEEIQKCDIVCANCHRNRTHKKGTGIKLAK